MDYCQYNGSEWFNSPSEDLAFQFNNLTNQLTITLLNVISRDVTGLFTYRLRLPTSGFTSLMFVPSITVSITVKMQKNSPYLVNELTPVSVEAGQSLDITLSESLFKDPDGDQMIVSWQPSNTTGIMFPAAPFITLVSSTILRVSPPKTQEPKIYLVAITVAKMRESKFNNTYHQWIQVEPPAPKQETPAIVPSSEEGLASKVEVSNQNKNKTVQKDDASLPSLMAFLSAFEGKVEATRRIWFLQVKAN